VPHPAQRPRVLLADDDAAMRTAIPRLLSLSCEVVACVCDTEALFEAVGRLRPDVVLLDFSIPRGANGLEVVRRLKSTTPAVHVIVFTGRDDEQLKRLAYQAGASGYVWKLNAADDLLPTIQALVDRMPPTDDDTA
jgi:two-component system, OmpR family, response regulator MprA